MKGSSAISARATAPRHIGRSSARRRHTPTSADEFALSGPSDLPDPSFNAYRRDLADLALASRVIASHYAEPVERQVRTQAKLHSSPSPEADVILEVQAGDPFLLLDESLGWAWGYAGKGRHVGYIPSDALLSSAKN
ncbi:MAG TPA: hypothetical protein VHE36_09405 [Sphingomicrobium sp.]|nr:hypothetical protein [Sphingomicrobium sp.]